MAPATSCSCHCACGQGMAKTAHSVKKTAAFRQLELYLIYLTQHFSSSRIYFLNASEAELVLCLQFSLSCLQEMHTNSMSTSRPDCAVDTLTPHHESCYCNTWWISDTKVSSPTVSKEKVAVLKCILKSGQGSRQWSWRGAQGQTRSWLLRFQTWKQHRSSGKTSLVFIQEMQCRKAHNHFL